MILLLAASDALIMLLSRQACLLWDTDREPHYRVSLPQYVLCVLRVFERTHHALALDWDSLAHHQAVMASPSYGSLLETLKPAFGGPSKMHHVIFNDHPIALEQPVTEVLLITLKDPSHRAEVFDILGKISDQTKKMIVFGPTLEDENTIIVVGGWESVEVDVWIF